MKIEKKYKGVVVPMITPFNENLSIDEEATENIVNHIIGGAAFPFILGTTGESASTSKVGKQNLVKATVQASAGRSIIYAGISNNSLYDSIDEARHYCDMGIDVLVANMASYYPVDSDQILLYFEELADKVPCPLIIYNIPATTHLSIPLEVVDQLSHHPNIVGFKDSERSMERLESSILLWKDREDFSFFSGWAAVSHTALTWGADGIVPSSGNLAPHLYQTIYSSGNKKSGLLAQDKADLISRLYQEGRTLSNALPVFKAMMSAYGLCQTHMMPPMYRLPIEKEKEISNNVLSQFGGLKQINTII